MTKAYLNALHEEGTRQDLLEWVCKLDAENDSLRAQLVIAKKALQFIADGYENHDINHVDYRVTVYQVATDALKDLP